MPCPNEPGCQLVNGVCRTCTYATPEAQKRAQNAPKIVVPEAEKKKPHGSHKVNPDKGKTRVVWRRDADDDKGTSKKKKK